MLRWGKNTGIRTSIMREEGGGQEPGKARRARLKRADAEEKAERKKRVARIKGERTQMLSLVSGETRAQTYSKKNKNRRKYMGERGSQ